MCYELQTNTRALHHRCQLAIASDNHFTNNSLLEVTVTYSQLRTTRNDTPQIQKMTMLLVVGKTTNYGENKKVTSRLHTEQSRSPDVSSITNDNGDEVKCLHHTEYTGDDNSH